MTELNPYIQPDDLDADITGAKSGGRRHTLDGSVCEACGVTHTVTTDSEDIPPEVYDKVSELLDDMPGDTRASEIILTRSSRKTKLLRDFIHFSRTLNRVNTHGPLLRAVAEVLDEMSHGAVERRWKVYQAQQELVLMHMILKTVNNMAEEFVADVEENQEKDVAKLLDLIEKSTIERVQQSAQKYRDAADEAEIRIDPQLIETGVFSEDEENGPASKFQAHTMTHGIASDVKRFLGGDDDEDEQPTVL